MRTKTKKQDKNGLWQKPWFKNIIIPIFVSIIAGLILWFLPKGNKDENNIHVTSYNQKGGITANQVNIEGKQQRHINDDLQLQLREMLKDFRENEIQMSYQVSDNEAFVFASEIKSFLENESWTVKGLHSAQYFSAEPREGIHVSPPKNGVISIKVYAQK